MRSLLLLAVLASGCGYDPPRTWSLTSAEWSAAERETLEAAAADVVAWTGEPVSVVWDMRADGRVSRGDALYRSDVSSSASMFISSAVTSDRLRVVFAHELCHALGMDHHDGHGLMHPAGGLHWTEEDAAECRRVGLARCSEPP